nr:TonB-dependent receptor [Aestuariicella hydrocarbonica]
MLALAIGGSTLLSATAGFAAQTFSLEEVVVTAQKREERALEVPISMAALGAEALEQSGIKEVKDLGEMAPNVQMSQDSDFSSRVTIRGVGANSRNIGFDTRVGVYLDGVYLGQSPAVNQGLVDLERVEVLRGPQGTLFGKNTVAGAVNLISRKPGDEVELELGVNVGNYNSREYQLRGNLPLTDTTAMSVSLNQTERDGYIKNLYNGDKVNGRDSTSGRVMLRSDLADNLTLSLAGDYMSQDRWGFNGEPLTSIFASGYPTAGNDKYEMNQNRTVPEDKEIWGTSATVDYDMDNGFSFKSITSYRYTEMIYGTDVDFTELDLVNTAYEDSYKQMTQEFQLTSPADSALSYVLGLYYYAQDSETERFALAGEHIGLFPFGIAPNSTAVAYGGTVDTESFSIYANGNYDITDRLSLGFGFRYSEETKDVDWTIDGSNSGGFNIATGSVKDSRTDRDLSPTLSVNFALTDNSFVYARTSTGVKSGGYNLDFVNADQFTGSPEDIEFDTESVISHELGYKAELLDRRLRLSSAVFYSKYDDYQVNQYIELGGGGTALTITNAAEVVSKGVELEATYVPTDNLQITAALGLLDTTFKSFPGGGDGGADASGNDLPYAPDTTASLGVQYYVPMPSLAATLLLRADYSYTSERYLTPSNNDGFSNGLVDVAYDRLESYDLVNARLGLIDDAEHWEVYLWGRNLADSDHMNYSFRDFLGTYVAGYAMPRTYGIEGKYRF